MGDGKDGRAPPLLALTLPAAPKAVAALDTASDRSAPRRWPA